MDTRTVYTLVVGPVALQRLAEIAVSKRNERRLRERGAVELGAEHYPWMVALHAAFLVSCVLEPWLLDRRWQPVVGTIAAVVFAVAQLCRVWVIRSLDGRWTVRVIVEPGARAIRKGPYRWLRHPNYLVVAVEIAALPSIHGAWLTAVVFSLLNLLVLRVRIRSEEKGLSRLTDWGGAFGDDGR